MSFEDNHPGLKGKAGFSDFAVHTDTHIGIFKDARAYREEDVAATQLDKQKVNESIEKIIVSGALADSEHLKSQLKRELGL